MVCNYCPPRALSCNYCNSPRVSWASPEEVADYMFQEALEEIREELSPLNNLDRKRNDYERGQRDALEFVLELLEKI